MVADCSAHWSDSEEVGCWEKSAIAGCCSEVEVVVDLVDLVAGWDGGGDGDDGAGEAVALFPAAFSDANSHISGSHRPLLCCWH